jgi:hypothetical protein
MKEVDASVAEAMAAYKKTDMTGPAGAVKVVETGIQTFQKVRDEELHRRQPGRRHGHAARGARREAAAGDQGGDAALIELKQIEEKSVHAISKDAHDTYVSARNFIVAVLVVGLRWPSPGPVRRPADRRPLRRVNEVLAKVAEGDLTAAWSSTAPTSWVRWRRAGRRDGQHAHGDRVDGGQRDDAVGLE